MDIYSCLDNLYGITSIKFCQQLDSVSRNRIYAIGNDCNNFIVRILERNRYDLEQLIFSCEIMSILNKELKITPLLYVSNKNSYVSQIDNKYVIVMEYIEHDSLNGCFNFSNISSSLLLMLAFVNYNIEKKRNYVDLLAYNKHKFSISSQILNPANLLHNSKNEYSYSTLNFMSRYLEFCFHYKNILGKDIYLIHGDIHRDNFLYKDHIATHIIDFDRITFDTLYVDLAFYIIWTCFMDESGNLHFINRVLYNFILNKYKKKINTNINFDYLNYFIIALLLKQSNISNVNYLNIIQDFIENIT